MKKYVYSVLMTLIVLMFASSATPMQNGQEEILTEQEMANPLLFTLHDAYVRILKDPQATLQEKQEAVDEFSRGLLCYHEYNNSNFLEVFPGTPDSNSKNDNFYEDNLLPE